MKPRIWIAGLIIAFGTMFGADASAAAFADASPAAESAACCETDFVAKSSRQRWSVVCASWKFACAVARSARAWRSCWSTSGVSISANVWPFFTRVPMSVYQSLT